MGNAHGLQLRAGRQVQNARIVIRVHHGLAAQGVKPVSYTHLDVYKRQLWNTALWKSPGAASSMPPPSPSRMGTPSCAPEPPPSSDVYKRQAPIDGSGAAPYLDVAFLHDQVAGVGPRQFQQPRTGFPDGAGSRDAVSYTHLL